MINKLVIFVTTTVGKDTKQESPPTLYCGERKSATFTPNS